MRWRCPHLFLRVLLISVLALLAAAELKICAYNVQKFNMEKASNPRLLHMLTKIVASCDIILLQEVTDSDGKAIKILLSAVNRESGRYDEDTYKSVSSKSLGNSPSDMQQYVFIYRDGLVSLTDQYQYEKKQSFTRAPFAVQFQSRKCAIKKFIVVPLHTEPSQAVKEIDKLYDVYEELSKKWNNQNMIFMGDFHAGCAYMTRANKKNIRLFTNTTFLWLINDKMDTTLSEDTNCPYDRIVVHGKGLLKAIIPFSAKVFNIPQEFKLQRSKVMELSSHLPVVMKLKSSATLTQATPLLSLLCFSAIIQSFLSTL